MGNCLRESNIKRQKPQLPRLDVDPSFRGSEDHVLDGDISTSMILRNPSWDFAKPWAWRNVEARASYEEGSGASKSEPHDKGTCESIHQGFSSPVSMTG